MIVTAALFMLTKLIALTGKKAIAADSPPVPTEAIDSTKADVAAVRAAVRR